MGQITDNPSFVPLIEYFEDSRTLLRASVRALVAMRLLDMYVSRLPGTQRVVINPATYELAVADSEETLWPREAFKIPEGTAWHRQGYALAIYISLILTGTHPYKGRRYFETAIIEESLMRRLFVEEPEYVLGSNSKALNAPLSHTQPHVAQLFNSLPTEWRTELKEVFGNSEKVWLPAEGDLTTSATALRGRLWAMYSMTASDDPVSIQAEGFPLTLSDGKLIALPSTLETVGKCEVKKSPRTGTSLLVVQNRTARPWKRVFIEDESCEPVRTSDVNPGEYLTLQPGVNFEKDDFDDIMITVRPIIQIGTINKQ